MDRDRLTRLRNYQSGEFYAALVIRPLTIAVLYPIADWRWLTPNRCTTIGNLAKLGAEGLGRLKTAPALAGAVDYGDYR